MKGFGVGRICAYRVIGTDSDLKVAALEGFHRQLHRWGEEDFGGKGGTLTSHDSWRRPPSFTHANLHLLTTYLEGDCTIH